MYLRKISPAKYFLFVIAALCMIIPSTYATEKNQDAKQLKQPLDYEKFLDYMQKDSHTELRLPTEQERQNLIALWPTVPLEENAVFYYARAISLAKKSGYPPGSASGMAKQ